MADDFQLSGVELAELAKWPESLIEDYLSKGRTIRRLESDISALESRVLALEVVEDWRLVGGAGEPPFQNGWSNFNATIQHARFRKIHNVVEVTGLIKGGTIGLPCFTLPPGYTGTTSGADTRIGKEAIDCNNAFGLVQVDSSGGVTVTTGSNVYCWITFSFGIDE